VTANNIYLVKKRILDQGKLWGVILFTDGSSYKAPSEDLLKLVNWESNATVLVDLTGGGDNPVNLKPWPVKTADGIRYAFRTEADGVVRNNFNSLPAVKLVSANKIKYLIKPK